MKPVTTHACMLFLLILALPIVPIAHAETLTETLVRQMLDNMDQACRDKQADGVLESMSDDIEIIMNINTGGNKQLLNPDKQKYRVMLTQGWGVYQNYSYSRTRVAIRIGSPRKAFVSSEITESMTVNGRIIESQAKEKMVVDLIGGKPLITRLTTYINM